MDYLTHKLNVSEREIAQMFEFGVQLAVGFSPLDNVVDLVSLATGYDVVTGEKLDELSTKMLAAGLLVGLMTGGMGDDLLDMGVDALRLADDVMDTGRALARQGDELLEVAARHGDDVMDSHLIVRRLDEYVARTDEIGEGVTTAVRHSDEADDVLYLADEAGGMSRYADEASIGTRADNLGGACTGNSFTAGTLVETEDGSKPIEEIEAGDQVLAEDPETGEQGYFEVVALTNHPTDEVLHITIEAETEGSDEAGTETTTQEVMEVTPDHPVYVEEKGWIWAENLEAGDELQTAEGGWAMVVSVEHVHLDEPEQVYNFTVKGPHTYFVLEVGVLVHNDIGKCPGTPTQRSLFNRLKEFFTGSPNKPNPPVQVLDEVVEGRYVPLRVNGGPVGRRYNTIPLRPGYEAETTPSPLDGTYTKYLSEGERARFEIFVEDGKLVHGDGTLVDTSQARSNFHQPGSPHPAIYVMDEHGRVFLSYKHGIIDDVDLSKIHHSSFLAGDQVAAAGEIEVRNGILVNINKFSGHYRPGNEIHAQILFELEERGGTIPSHALPERFVRFVNGASGAKHYGYRWPDGVITPHFRKLKP